MPFVNEGLWDRLFRFLIGVALGYAAWTNWPGAAAIVFALISTVAFATGLAGWCPLYAVFGFSTRKKTAA